MSGWEKYKETFNLSKDIFTLARSGEAYCLRMYLNANPDINIDHKNNKGYSPLMIAVYNGHIRTSEILLERGADPNSTDFSGNTVLMGAAFKGDIDIVKLLIEKGAQKDLENLDGLTAEKWASAFGRNNVVSLLRPDAHYSVVQNKVNAIKALWGFIKTIFRKELIA